jgi:hypothetical protein
MTVRSPLAGLAASRALCAPQSPVRASWSYAKLHNLKVFVYYQWIILDRGRNLTKHEWKFTRGKAGGNVTSAIDYGVR